MPLKDFHPAVSAWFAKRFDNPTEAQAQAWPAIRKGNNTLVAAPTGAGKTLAAFLAAIDALVCEGLERGLENECHVLYVSPLKALSNDVQKNLQEPLGGIRDRLLEQGLPDVDIRAWVRTGDTPPGERERMRKQPPHIIVTTPESLYILLTSESGRQMLRTVRTVVVDEIHALAGNKRGAHLSLSLERLSALCTTPPVRVGLSATQKPIEEMARFLTGADSDCRIIDTGHVRERDLALEVPGSPLEAIMSGEVWQEVYDRLAALIEEHRTTLIFVNTRRLAERAARFLAERVGEENVTAHHGSLAREHRLDAEQRLKAGKLRALVATASLELGIDIGDVDLVCQLGSPRSIAAFLQRVGRSGHSMGEIPKGRLFPLSRDELVECTALLDAVRRDELDRIHIPEHPLDVLAQQIVAEVANGEQDEQALFENLRKAWPYRNLTCEAYTAVIKMLAEGFSTRRGRRSAYLHRDAVNGRLRPRRGARLTAITNGGTIPDQFDFNVMLAPEDIFIGTLNEDFAFESLPGDIFQLGNTSYRILKVETRKGTVIVEDAKGQPPNIPFWFGEAPGRSDELSTAVSRLRETLDQKLADGILATVDWLQADLEVPQAAAHQLAEYLSAARAALGGIPTQKKITFERFFDEMGDMHFVIHAPFGSRINRAWGLALRKRFCRKFNFELQAAATEDNVVLSLGPTHSFALPEVANYLKSDSVRDVLTQALLDAPMFEARWRWNASIALAVKRMFGGKRQPAQFQRSDAEDLIAVVFPDQLACLENIAGNREVPDHPLVQQTLNDCLHDTMDIEGLEHVLHDLEQGRTELTCCDLTSPSPLAQEILNARPYAFLDDAPAEERRTQAVQQRRYLDPASAAELGRLDPQVIQQVREQAWPEPRTADELHDGLLVLGFLTEEEGLRGPLAISADETLEFGWQQLFEVLLQDQRATRLTTPAGNVLWVAVERLQELLWVFPDAGLSPILTALPDSDTQSLDDETALLEIIRSRLEGLGPVTARQLAQPLSLEVSRIERVLLALEQEGYVIQGQFTEDARETEWCERGLLARIHRYTLKQLRSEIEPVSPAAYMRFLLQWQHLDEPREGQDALADIIAQLEGFAIPAAAWEGDVIPARLQGYFPDWLDNLCTAGQVTWQRLELPKDKMMRQASPVRTTPITLLLRSHARFWRSRVPVPQVISETLSASAQKVFDVLSEHGASFFDDILHDSGLLRSQLQDALGELVARGLITADSFAGLRTLITPNKHRRRRRRHNSIAGIEQAGRWALLKQRRKPDEDALQEQRAAIEHIAFALLRRYGVVFRKALERESHLPPWRELLYVYRRLEARGEVRGGRFLTGMSGEQYALPEAVGALRKQRNNDQQGKLIAICAADPLNLLGIILPGERVPAQKTNRILFRDGLPVAIHVAGKTRFVDELDPKDEWEVRNLLLRQQHPERYLAPSTRPT